MANIFISYNFRDSSVLVERLAQALRNSGHEVWWATESIRPADSIPLAISEGLSTSEVFLVVLSPNYQRSPWCQRELGAIVGTVMGSAKILAVVRVGEAPVPTILNDILRVEVPLEVPDDIAPFAKQINLAITGTTPESPAAFSTEYLVDRLFEANNARTFGASLLTASQSDCRNLTPSSEGVILIKPGGTFFRPCLEEIFRRITRSCEVRQLRLFDGYTVELRKLFEQQYVTSTKIASGEIPLSEIDYENIAKTYGTPEFEANYKFAYSRELVVPALLLCSSPYNLSPQDISTAWEAGRKPELFWNRQWDGLNKIGYQKTVFPISFPQLSEPRVRLVLNGFIPGYRELFVNPNARTVALHVRTRLPWGDIREKLVGGKSNPNECPQGSIRRDAAERKIPLEAGAVVNGQRNVCHCSATLFDGMRELVIWFEYNPQKTILGEVFSLRNVDVADVWSKSERILSDVSWVTRDNTVDEILLEVRHRVVLDNLKAEAGPKRDTQISRYAREANVSLESVRDNPHLLDFVRNGHRLAASKDELYLSLLGQHLFKSASHRALFFEIGHAVKSLVDRRCTGDPTDVLAEAYRVAASDLCFLDCPAYEKIANPRLFRARVVGELPEHALDCAVRTRKNLVREISTLKSPKRPESSRMLIDTDEWKNFLSSRPPPATPKGEIVGLILGGGRSTRMSSTIPKAVLPFGARPLFMSALDVVQEATSGDGTYYCAAGFRSDLVRLALEGHVQFLEYRETLGLAFRVATCLESLKNWESLVVLAYTDMPLVSAKSLQNLITKVQAETTDTFGMLTTQVGKLSGHVERMYPTGQISRVIQARLNPELCKPFMEGDVGFYVFRNSPRFRAALGRVCDGNVRGEFILADVVEILAGERWKILSEEEDDPYRVQDVNWGRDLLLLATGAYHPNASIEVIRQIAEEQFTLRLRTDLNVQTFRNDLREHVGPLYCFSWWNDTWAEL